MKQLTIRITEEALQRRLHQVARQHGLSLNKAALLLLAKGAGLDKLERRSDIVGTSLDDLIGTWSETEEQAFLDTTQVFEQIDPMFWS